MNRIGLCFIPFLAIGGWFALDGKLVAQPRQAAKADPAPLQKFMRAKLKASDQILEGLVTEKFDLITAGAQAFQKLSKAEQWRVSESALYRQHSAEFLRIAQRLEGEAKQKNLEGAALAWIETTMSCIECHKYSRTILISDR
jgi:hypothetical protein